MTELARFCILAKTQPQKSRACEALVQQVLTHRKIFTFAELLNMPSVASLQDSEFAKSYDTLKLFAFGQYSDYTADKTRYLELSEPQITKLKQLSIVSIAENNKIISYDTMQKELDIADTRQLEDLIIEAMNSGLITGKMNPKERILRVFSVLVVRDLRPEQLTEIIAKLKLWKKKCHEARITIEQNSEIMRQKREVDTAEHKDLQDRYDAMNVIVKEGLDSGMDLEDINAQIHLHQYATTSTSGNSNNNDNSSGRGNNYNTRRGGPRGGGDTGLMNRGNGGGGRGEGEGGGSGGWGSGFLTGFGKGSDKIMQIIGGGGERSGSAGDRKRQSSNQGRGSSNSGPNSANSKGGSYPPTSMW